LKNANLNIDYSIAIFEKKPQSYEWLSSCLIKQKEIFYLNSGTIQNLACIIAYGKKFSIA